MEPTTEDLSVFNAEESPIRYLSEDEEEVSTKDSSEEEERPAKNVVTGKDFAKLTKKLANSVLNLLIICFHPEKRINM